MKGICALIGGGDRTVLRDIISLTQSKHILIIATASEMQSTVFNDYKNKFRDIDQNIILETPELVSFMDINKQKIIDLLDVVDTVFFTGGDQTRLAIIFNDSKFLEKLKHNYFKNKLSIIGTSAGSQIMGTKYLYDGDGLDGFKNGMTETDFGFNILDGFIIDSHFFKRGRTGRLLQAMDSNAICKGIGIAEDTAIVIDENNLITIYGVAEVAFFDIKKANSNLFNVGNHENFSIRNVRCHYLSKNESINMELK